MRLGVKNNEGKLETVVDLNAPACKIIPMADGFYLCGCGHGQWYAQDQYAQALKDKKEFEDAFRKGKDV